jgi:hypothetical protein
MKPPRERACSIPWMVEAWLRFMMGGRAGGGAAPHHAGAIGAKSERDVLLVLALVRVRL